MRRQVYSKEWRLARQKSDELNEFIANASGTATLEDVRRWEGAGSRVAAGEGRGYLMSRQLCFARAPLRGQGLTRCTAWGHGARP